MIVKCSKCKQKVERFDTGDYGFPNICSDCLKKFDFKLMKCKLCSKKGYFDMHGFKDMRRYQCPHCKAYFIPFRMRHFGNKYEGYPKWTSWKDWRSRKYAPELEVENIKY